MFHTLQIKKKQLMTKYTGDIWFLLFYSSLITNRKQTGQPARQKKYSRSVNASKNKPQHRCRFRFCNGTWLCFLCCCLLITTLGVTCVNQLCSVFGHQFDHAWKTKQDHILCQYILTSTLLLLQPLNWTVDFCKRLFYVEWITGYF